MQHPQGLFERLMTVFPDADTAFSMPPSVPLTPRLVQDTVFVLEPKSAGELGLDILVAASTVVVAILAYLEIQRAGRAEEALRTERAAKTRAADAQIAAEAYAVLRRATVWASGASALSRTGITYKRAEEWLRLVLSPKEEVSAAFVRMIAVAPEASADQAHAVRNAYLHWVNLYLISEKAQVGMAESVQLHEDARNTVSSAAIHAISLWRSLGSIAISLASIQLREQDASSADHPQTL